MTGDPEREPLRAGCEQALHLAGLQALAGTLLALFHALRTGKGQRVDVSVQEAVASVLESTLSEYQYHGIVRERMGTHHPAVHGVGMQRLADGRFLYVGTCPRPAMWEAVKDVMGRPAWADDVRWDDPRVRRGHADEIDRLAAETFSTRTLDEVYVPLQERGVPVGVVNSISEAADSPQLREREFFVEVGQARMPGPLWKTTAAASEVRPAPRLGEHTSEVLRELGLARSDAIRLRRAGVI
jgi:crotonobetainyl-CoA:carnitine CoA-transferase CaiB-like acyl-CoA transferase